MKPAYTIAHTECSLGWGGQEIRVFTEMQAMRARGHRVLLCAPAQSKIFEKAGEAGFTVFPIHDGKLRFAGTVLRLASLFRREKVQIVNPHSSRDGWLAGLAGRLAGVPLIIRSRHIEVDYPSRLLSRIAYHHLPHHVFTTSQRISEGLIQALSLAPSRVTCVPTGIDLRKFNPDAVTATLHAELKLPRETPLVAMISVLRSWKGHDFLLAAAKQVIAVKPQPHFVIAGEGPRRAWIEQQIREGGLEKHVTLLGHRDDVPNLLASAQVVVLPSTAHEGIPQIILQAQAMGKAVIGTTIGGIPEVVTDGQTGLLVAPSDAGALAQAILRLLGDEVLAFRLGLNARQVAREEYGLDRMCERLEAVYARRLAATV
ncbi:MAG: glycosyltransferase family 4 protein [Verrucomicrobiota bacterium]